MFKEVFLNKGWFRLLTVVSGLWLVLSASFVLFEKESINSFDQFDNPPPSYTFFSWSGRNSFGENPNERQLTVNRMKVVCFTVIPIFLLWVIALSFVWISNGFKQSNKKT